MHGSNGTLRSGPNDGRLAHGYPTSHRGPDTMITGLLLGAAGLLGLS